MRTGLCLCVAAALACAVGCATPQELDAAARQRETARPVVESFVAALRDKTPEALRPDYLPSLAPAETARLEMKCQQASWLQGFARYAPDVQAVLDGAGWREWTAGRVSLELPRPKGDEEGDVILSLAESEGRWWIEGFDAPVPVRGSRLDLPSDVVRCLRAQAVPLMDALRDGHVYDVYYALPDQPGARMRSYKMSTFERLMQGGGGVGDIADDLEIVKQLKFISWPDMNAPLQAEHLGPGVVGVIFEIPHVWSTDEGATEPETLTVELVFVLERQGCQFYGISLTGVAIPYSM